MRYIITGGGTAGHINPGIAIAKEIRKNEPDSEILFIGTKKGLESTLVPREGFKIEYIEVQGFQRKISIDSVKSIRRLFKGLVQAKKVIKEYKPDMVIGTGGYVCGPVVYIAAKKKIPALIHEQNAYPGVTNRILSRCADIVAVGFRNTEKYFSKRAEIIYTGNPIRSDLILADREACRRNILGDDEKPLVVVFGGSLGAERINDSIIGIADKYMDSAGFRLLFATGKKHYDVISGEIQKNRLSNVECVPYIYNMGEVMAAADLAVCRAGAITLSELTALGIPSILIPSPYVTANHQEHNARTLENAGASVVILENELTPEVLYHQIHDLISNKNILQKMSKSAKKLGVPDAVEKIYKAVRQLIVDGWEITNYK